MTTNNDLWELYVINYRSLMAQAKILNCVKLYDKEIFDNIRDLYYNNIPAVILLLENDFAQGKTIENSKLLSYALNNKNCEIVVAKVDGLKYNPKYVKRYEEGLLDDSYSIHHYVRVKESDGQTWVYDPAMAIKIEESIYNSMQNPEIISIQKKSSSVEDIGLIKLKGKKLNAKAPYINDTITTVKEYHKLIREEYREVFFKELNAIEEKISIPANEKSKEKNK